MSTSVSPSDLARATLVALHGAAGVTASTMRDVTVFLPELVPLVNQQAVARLASLAKPLVCVAVVLSDSLYVGTWTVPRPSSIAATHVDAMREILQSEISPDGDFAFDVVVCNVAGEVATLTREQFEQWVNDYDIPLATVRLTAAATDDVRRARVVVLFEPLGSGWMNA